MVRAALEDFRSQSLAEGNAKSRVDHKDGPLAKAYEKVMLSIQGQPPDKKVPVIHALSWITFARTPLSKRELQHALAFSCPVLCDDPNF